MKVSSEKLFTIELILIIEIIIFELNLLQKLIRLELKLEEQPELELVEAL
jgi:hypothetical protein